MGQFLLISRSHFVLKYYVSDGKIEFLSWIESWQNTLWKLGGATVAFLTTFDFHFVRILNILTFTCYHVTFNISDKLIMDPVFSDIQNTRQIYFLTQKYSIPEIVGIITEKCLQVLQCRWQHTYCLYCIFRVWYTWNTYIIESALTTLRFKQKFLKLNSFRIAALKSSHLSINVLKLCARARVCIFSENYHYCHIPSTWWWHSHLLLATIGSFFCQVRPDKIMCFTDALLF